MLRLGVYKLPLAEVVVIQTIVRLYASDAAFPWQLVSSPPYDALLVDGSSVAEDCPEVAGMAAAVLRLTRMHSGGQANTLERPIRADKLQRWLTSTELALREAQPAGPAPDDETALEIEVSDSVRFTLLRWPPALLLRNDLDNIRMASLLARRALNAHELAGISHLPFSQCVSFLHALRTAGVLELHVTPAVPPSLASRNDRAMRGDFARSLINGIRRRLGLRTA
ncbi:hypothetical protein J7E49_21310 [Variovorax paradoxus]|nr:hypothetical protein [Variovorax paradoxus]